jgi:alkylation response protein AidB-like acyl-CoA dehydrogenase
MRPAPFNLDWHNVEPHSEKQSKGQMMTMLDEQLASWLDAHADSLDRDASQADALLPLLASSHLPKVGVPESEGGSGGPISAAIGVVADLAEHSLSAAFVFWAQRACIECVLRSPNRPLVDRLLPSLLDGSLAGAPGLSNAMKFLSGFDQLQMQFIAGPKGVRMNGAVQWATNLRKQSFVVALAAGNAETGNAAVFAVPHYLEGVTREPDLDLMGLRSTNTAAVRLTDVAIDDDWQVHPDAKVFLPQIRPGFVGLQCGLGLGLARASLRSVREAIAGSSSVLLGELNTLERSVNELWRQLSTGLDNGRLSERPAELLELRIRMVELAASAVQLELQALGGRAYLNGKDSGFARRWRELAFLPIVTPTVVQLKTQLAKSNGNR